MTVLGDFQARLFSQFDDSTNIQALVSILSDPLQDTKNVLDFILDHSSIDTAQGEQLELLGGLIGVTRPRLQETRIFTLCRNGEIQDINKGFKDDDFSRPGGYLTTFKGLEDQADPNSEMSDADYRKLIRQRAASYRKKMTREILYLYLLEFGARCKIDDDETMTVLIDPEAYYTLNNWAKNYIETRGFKPAGISVDFIDNLRNEASI